MTTPQPSNVRIPHSSEMTFGIELEFLALYPEPTFSYLPGPTWDKTCSQALHRMLAARGVPVTGGIGDDEDDGEDIFAADEGPSYSKWCVQAEGGLVLDEAEEEALGVEARRAVSEECIEISSRKLSFERDDWRREVSVVLEVIQELREQGVVFVANATTGLHVHIGYGDVGVPLEAAKGVLQLALAFEQKLDTLYTAPRISHAVTKKCGHFNAPLSWTFANSPATQHCRGDLFAWLEYIADCEDIEEVCGIFKIPRPDSQFATIDGHYSVLNLDNLYQPAEENDYGPPKGTIEFRQHAGTLDFNDIVAHVELCATMVKFCTNASASEISRLCLRVRSPVDLGILNLLASIGCRRQLVTYYHSRFSGHTQQLKRQSSQILAAQIVLGRIDGLKALDAQVTIGCLQRASAAVVGREIALKKHNGSYGRR